MEDDEQIRKFVKTLLTSDGFEVVEARDGLDGKRVAQAGVGAIDLLVADMLLPGLSGYDLAVRLRETKPDLKILFMTGYVEGDVVQRCVSELNAMFLDKPFQPAELRAKVREMLAARGATADPGRSLS